MQPKQKDKLTRRLSTAVMEAFNPKVELQVKFGLELGADESVLDCFAAAYYPPSGLLVQGKMIVTAKYLAFRADLAVTSWGSLRILLRLQDVTRLEKANTAMNMVPNALTLSTKYHGSYFFGSFLDRDQTFYLIKSMVEVERHIVELQALALREGGESGEDDALPPQKPQQQLELGIQKPKPRSRAVTATTTTAAATPASAVKPSKGSLPPPDTHTPTSMAASPSSSPSFSSPAAPAPASASSEQDDAPPEDLPAEIKRLFYESASASAPVVLMNAHLDVPLQALFRENVLHCYNFCDFLTHRGEQVGRSSCTEWAPLPAAEAQAAALEAQAQGVAFTYSRQVRFRHQRTFSALQGVLPSHVDSETRQYLHIYGRKGPRVSSRRPSMGRDSFSGSMVASNLGSCRPLRCVLLSVTTCSRVGVLPLLDSFKLLTFWLLEDSISYAASPHPDTHLRCCAKVLPLSSLKLLSSLPSLGPSLVQHLEDGLLDRSALTARAWVAWVSDRTREYQREAALGQAALEAMSTALGDATKSGPWSARGVERVARFGRHHVPILTLQDLKREQRVDQEAKRGRNSFNLLSHAMLLLFILLAAAAAVLLQAQTNAHVASQLSVLRGELGALEAGVRRRGQLIEQARASKGSKKEGVASWISAPSLLPSSFTVSAWGSPST